MRWGGVRGGGRHEHSIRDAVGNDSQNAVDIVHDIVIPETKHTISIRFEERRAQAIGFRLSGFVVMAAIKLNNDPPFMTRKVDKERANGRLSSKMR